MSYRIVRYYQRPNIESKTVRRGLTLEEAQEHCNDPQTSSRTCTTPAGRKRTREKGDWFEGYTEE
jgi:hypothetical protein